MSHTGTQYLCSEIYLLCRTQLGNHWQREKKDFRIERSAFKGPSCYFLASEREAV